MNPRKIFFIFLVFAPFMTSAQLNLSWYSGTCPSYTGSYPFDIKLDAEGNSYACGYDNAHNACIRKVNPQGTEIWFTSFDSVPGNEEFHSILLDSAGYLYVTGTIPGGSIYPDALTCKYDTSGNLTWCRIYDGPGMREDCGDFLCMQNSGNILVGGNSWSPTGNVEVLILSYDPNGNLSWNAIHNIWSSTGDYIRGLSQDQSGNIYAGVWNSAVCSFDSTGAFRWATTALQGNTVQGFCGDQNGNTYVCGYSGAFPALQKFDANGNETWDTIYSAPASGLFSGICLDESNNLYVCGRNNSSATVVSFDASNNFRWSYTSALNNTLANRISAGKGIVAFAGDYNPGQIRAYTGAFDTSGVFIGDDIYLNSGAYWSRNYPAGPVIDTSGNIRVAGQQVFQTPICYELYILRYDVSPLEIKNDTYFKSNLFSLYPNPATADFKIRLPENETEARLTITDVAGRIVYSEYLSENETEIKTVLSPGLYFPRLIFNSGKVQSLKLIIR